MIFRKKIVGFFLIAICVVLTPAAFIRADEPATQPSAAEKLLKTAFDDFDANKPQQALDEFHSGEDAYVKEHGTRETADYTQYLGGEGLCLRALDHPSDAQDVFQSAIDILRRINKDQDDADLATMMMNDAACFEEMDKPEKALDIGQKTLEMMKRLSNGDDAQVLAICTSHVADYLAELDRQKEAAPLYRSAMEMQQRLHKNQDDEEVAIAETSYAWSLYSLGHFDDALPVYKDALEMRRRIYKDDDETAVIRSLNNVAQCLCMLGRLNEAVPLYQSAMEMARRFSKNQDNAELATLTDNLAACTQSLGHLDDAIALFQQALEMRQRIAQGQDDDDVATSLNNLATCLGHLGRDEEALRNSQAAINMMWRIYKGQDSPEVATALNNFGVCLNQIGRYTDALAELQAALDMRVKVYGDQDHPDIANSLSAVAECYCSLGRYGDALSCQQDALNMLLRLNKDQDHSDVAQAFSDKAVILDNLGRSAEALPLYQNALEMRRRLYNNRPHPDIAVNLSLIGGCLLGLNRADDAIPYCREALEMEKIIYNDRDHPIVAWSMGRLATSLSDLHHYAEAVPIYQSAIEMSQRLHDPSTFTYCTNFGNCLLAMGKLEEAAAAYNDSINAFERARALVGGDDQDRISFMRNQDDYSPYSMMFDVQLRMNHPEKAAEYLDRGRARNLLDNLERAQRQSGGDILASAELKAQQDHNDALLKAMANARNNLLETEDKVQKLTSQINFARSLNSAEGDAQVDELLPKLDEACKVYGNARQNIFYFAGPTTFSEPASMEKIQSLIKPHQHLLMYAISLHDPAIIVIPPAGRPITGVFLNNPDGKNPTPGMEILQLLVNYEKMLVNNRDNSTRGAKPVRDNSTTSIKGDMHETGHELFEKLMPAAVWREIKDDDLVYVVPDAMMNGLPLETLVVEKPQPDSKDCKYWLDEGPVLCYGPSAAALLKLCDPKSNQGTKHFSRQAVLLGDPVLQRESNATTNPSSSPQGASRGGYGHLAPLPGTRREVDGIYQVLTGHPHENQSDDSVVVLLGEDATTARLADAVVGARFVHLATHGLVKSGSNAVYSGVVLSQPRDATSSETGILTVEDLFNHWGGKLRDTELVVLSACDSQGIDKQSADALYDEGVFGLPWGFWYAGAPAVVASLWEVQDDSTAKLMQEFYRDLGSPSSKNKLAAFTAARKELRKEYPEPFYWAPFIYLGNPN